MAACLSGHIGIVLWFCLMPIKDRNQQSVRIVGEREELNGAEEGRRGEENL